jgi:hypothetical protein
MDEGGLLDYSYVYGGKYAKMLFHGFKLTKHTLKLNILCYTCIRNFSLNTKNSKT